VPDYGGVGEVIQLGKLAGGLTFRTWDSGDVARQLARLLTDTPLYSRLASQTRAMAARFDVETMTDQILTHMGLGNMAVGDGSTDGATDTATAAATTAGADGVDGPSGLAPGRGASVTTVPL